MKIKLRLNVNSETELSHDCRVIDDNLYLYCWTIWSRNNRLNTKMLLEFFMCVGKDVFIRRWNRFCDPIKKKNWCDVGERNRESWLLRTFLKPSLKMPSIFCEFGCYYRKLCVNKSISFFSYNTGRNVNKKNDTPTTKVNKIILHLVRS